MIKRSISILVIVLITVACNNENHSTPTKGDTDVVKNNGDSDYTAVGIETDKGSQLLASSDCASCHKTNERLVGPSYTDIANKYDITKTDYLADKIIKGGTGVWGQVPMTPHPDLKMEDAREMAKYVLEIKK